MKTIHTGLLACLMLPMIASAANPEPPLSPSEKDGLAFRFTGVEAQKLLTFLKARTPEKKDTKVQYHGDKMSLACSVRNDCFLYLSKKEWKASGASDASLSLRFALPLHQSVLQGELAIAPPTPGTDNRFQLRLQDVDTRETFSFQKELRCSIPSEWTDEYLKGDGDCRLDPAGDKKYLTYQPSLQYVENSDNVVTVLRGPWAEKLFRAGGEVTIDEADPAVGRVSLGSQFYCWDQDLSGQELPLEERYFCQIKHLPTAKNPIVFTAEGQSQNEKFSLIMRPRFDRGLVEAFDLSYRVGEAETSVDSCPYNRTENDSSQCSFVLNYRRDVIYYPLWKPVQGVAVGWGVAPDPEN